MLNESELYQRALGAVKSEEERRKIKAFAEDMFLNIARGLTMTGDVVKENPQKVAEVAEKRIPKE